MIPEVFAAVKLAFYSTHFFNLALNHNNQFKQSDTKPKSDNTVTITSGHAFAL